MDARADPWEAVHQRQAWGRWPNEHFIRFVARNYGTADRADTHFLELGCGAGAQMWFLGLEGYSVTGIDSSRRAVERANDMMRLFQLEEGAVQMSLQELVMAGPPERLFDCVYDVACLQCLPYGEARAAVGALVPFLKPGGRIFSLMASASGDEMAPKGASTRRAFRHEVEALFRSYVNVQIGHETVDRPDGPRVAHWIVQGERPI